MNEGKTEENFMLVTVKITSFPCVTGIENDEKYLHFLAFDLSFLSLFRVFISGSSLLTYGSESLVK